jgi:hypothetical protein
VRFLHFLARLVGWLLTPLIAWAASFFGAWAGAAAATSVEGANLSLGLTIMGGAAAGVGATMLWMRLLRRSPHLREALAVTAEGIPVAALEEGAEASPPDEVKP